MRGRREGERASCGGLKAELSEAHCGDLVFLEGKREQERKSERASCDWPEAEGRRPIVETWTP